MSLFDDEAHCKDGDSEEDSSGVNDYDYDDSFIASENDEESISTNESSFKEVQQRQEVKKTRKGAGRPNIKKRKMEVEEKPVGHLSYPVNDFSLTITKKGGDVANNTLDLVFKFIEEHCLKGMVAFEVGKRAFNMHIQGLFRVHYPKSKGNLHIYVYIKRKRYSKILSKFIIVHIAALTKLIKSYLPSNGLGYKINLKVFGSNQTFDSMVGYVTKDRGKAHYQLRTLGVTKEVIKNHLFFFKFSFKFIYLYVIRKYQEGSNLIRHC